ncbi:rab GTPase-activating protein 1-like isoform X1 [Maniola jurtina]|uniref:rab GTPase-activating protein 1-like isoform X1 n=1 Tax=Maniola jurtina TaxID=191418 RepID=UPI001E6895B8|nr:rab GTPase-activating protein 1-like isoform X1 [Maniola jurtina]XP_045785955.1 rab GTPase-activating protein 1-like isoform X1 [Maniola jurtina]XP_045785956.1 rab GTPase-activating protein 1-like isoform X1 [Maniola jurtina]
MEFNGCRMNEVSDPADIEFYPGRSQTPSPVPVLTTNVCCDLEDILSDAISESLQSSLRISRSQLINQELTIRPEANIESNVPEGLDLYKVIYEVESDSDTKMGDTVDGSSAPNAPVKNQDSCRHVGGSKFYEMIEGSASADTSTPSPTEKHDHMKPIESDDEVSDVDQECTVFCGVSYLGAQNIADPKSETDIQRIMKELSSMPENRDGIAVSISIPVCSQGLVVLYQADTNSVMTRYAVNRISFYARGAAGSPVASCFAFTWSHGETKESAVYRCHVFRCHIAEAVNQVSSCFAKAFERIPRSMASSLVGDLSAAPSMTGSLTEGIGPAAPPMQLMHVLECTVDIKETDAKGTFSHVPKERLGYKLRGGIDKQVTINVTQVSNNVQADCDDPQASYTGGLYIERCFGILLAPGRSVKHSDMQLLEMVSGSSGGSGCSVCALWNAGESALAAFNVASGDGAPAYMSLALDLVIRGIRDPLRLVVEAPVKVYPPTERFWYYSKRPLVQQFFINLKESVDSLGQLQYEVASVETSGELNWSRLNLPLSLSSLLQSPLSAAPAPPSPSEPDSDGDEPLLSGTGEVSKDCGVDVLENWAQVLRSWIGPRPRALSQLVRVGVPEALRGEVWLRLAGVDQNDKLMETYRTLISKDCPFEAVIQRDIARTFPAHDFFREAGGLGQDSLLRMARAYAVYDHEVGYCQGLSFLAATLLLHMPEEQAFCLLVRLMYGYGLRELYKDGFEALYMRLHQLDRLMEEQLSDLRAHFLELGVEPHMFASQWFLTVFTARFPLPLVYHILDVFLLQGMDTLFQVSLALLTRARKDLLQHDFEGILKYFRVTLPKKCRAEEASRQIVKLACSIKVKRLQKYQLEYEKFVKESAEKEKINVELERLKGINSQLQQDKEMLEAQLAQSRHNYEEARKESVHYAAVSRDYREICARLDKQLHQVQDCVKSCMSCSLKLAQKDNKEEVEQKGEEEKENPSDTEARLKQRVRDLELELAQVKLAHVQAQCSNQELSHQLNAAVNEMQAAMNQKHQNQTVAPWLVRTLGSIMEAAQNRPSFQTYLPNLNPEQQSPSLPRQGSFSSTQGQSHVNLDRRVSDPYSPDVVRRKKDLNAKRHSMLVESNLTKEVKDLNRRSHEVIVKNLSMG